MVHITNQEEITEDPTGSIDTSTTSNTEKLPGNAQKYDGWKGENQKYKARRADTIKSEIPKFTRRCTDLFGFIYELGPNQTDKYIKMTPETEYYAGRTYVT